ncbi:hypothetical protein SOCEGT47_073650 [Sorangium cellulosum]|jgi:hypothetical protein|uniref:Secreted protein n=1 Tax=Sorangium cellulosum TaxID=56 RepID=A0A4P2QAY4_SORCE|nr:hypothetical protein [Sorangium cellulosum]AUX26795.1 hypothetical protein SOCEGT47_073650 [Sorangium cellulosum]
MSCSSGRSPAALVLFLLACACGPSPEKVQSAPPAPPLKQCGTEVVKRGEGYDARARECIWQAYKDREPAEFTTTRYTIEGDPITYHLEVTLTGVVVVVNSKDRYALQGVFRHACRNLERIMQEGSEDRFGFALSACSGGGAERFAVP